MAQWAAVLVALIAGAIIVLRLLYPLPPLGARPNSAAIPASKATTLGARYLPAAAARPGLSGVRPLPAGPEAFAARVMLARQAEVSIDAQYYIWQLDTTGVLLLAELRNAAERGVRVRLLLDDNGIEGLDEELAALDAHSGVEVRLWNPFTIRSPKALGYFFDFPRLNRRMHNKSFTVDGVATIVGGRNIGDVYFAYGGETHYVDLDALAVGPAAEAVAADFDLYWASASAYLASSILPPSMEGLDLLEAAAVAAQAAPETTIYAEAIAAMPLLQEIDKGEAAFEWVPVTLLSDDPAKGLGQAGMAGMLLTRLLGEVGEITTSLDVVSAYFVPGPTGVESLYALEEQGVEVRVLTNAWEATDVPLVHAGYVRGRPALLDGGVEMLELRATAGATGTSGVDLAGPNIFGSSTASLHAKTTVFDRERVFVGSVNLDPRSERLNTEMGMLIDSPTIAGRVAAMMDGVAPNAAYLVERGPGGGTVWVGTDGDGQLTKASPEPGTTWASRLFLRGIALLPIEWLL